VRCERAREWMSAALDDELPEIFAVRLEAHLRHCEPCTSTYDAVAATTLAIRATPLEQVRVARVATGCGRAVGVARWPSIAATAAIVAAGVGALVGTSSHHLRLERVQTSEVSKHSPDLEANLELLLQRELNSPRGRMVPI
jgi:hypothetical protein